MIAPVKEDEDVIMISSDGIVIRTHVDQISTFQRPSKGVKVMRVNEGEKVATISVVDRFEDDANEDSTDSAAENPQKKTLMNQPPPQSRNNVLI